MSVEKNNVDWSIKKTFVNLNVLFVTFVYAYFFAIWSDRLFELHVNACVLHLEDKKYDCSICSSMRICGYSM